MFFFIVLINLNFITFDGPIKFIETKSSNLKLVILIGIYWTKSTKKIYINKRIFTYIYILYILNIIIN